MNKKRLLIRFALALILCALASADMVGAFALSNSDPLLYADLSKAAFQFDYTPMANSEYALYLYSADGGYVHAQAELIEKGEVIASGEGSGEIFSLWLVSGTKYTVRVHGEGFAVIEMARNALSRCLNDPLWVQENSANGKMVARAYDAHWYAFTADEAGEIMLCGVPDDEGLALKALLFDENHTLLADFEPLSGGVCKLQWTTEAGKSYYVRISSPNGASGYYHMNLIRAAQPADPAFSQEEYALSMGESRDLSYALTGSAALWISDAPEIVSVNQEGRVFARSEGSARITAHGFGASAACTVTVENIALEGLSFIGERLKLNVGDDASVELQFTPPNASITQVRFEIDDPEIAQISEQGVLQALGEGTTLLRVYSADGAYSDSIALEVSPAPRKYRALLVGEQNYPVSVNTTRNGSENSVNAIAGLLGTMDYASAGFRIQTAADVSKSELIYAIRTQFARATAQDVSLFYISCHGTYSGGMSFLELSDGSSMAVRDLERELRRIEGTVVVLIDCCGSGGAIGQRSDYAAFAKGAAEAFAASAVSLSKYKVICSAGLDQDSFRIAFNAEADNGAMATVFTRALCDGAGWNLDRSMRSSMAADQNYDRAITLAELAQYMEQRVDWYLNIASELIGDRYVQSVQVYPEGDPFVLFER